MKIRSSMEYIHLDEVKSFDTDLIEMETSTFYAIGKIMEVPAIACQNVNVAEPYKKSDFTKVSKMSSHF